MQHPQLRKGGKKQILWWNDQDAMNAKTRKKQHLFDDGNDEFLTHQPTRNDGPKEAQLDDMIYSYGREEVIKQFGENTPKHVLRAYKEYSILR